MIDPMTSDEIEHSDRAARRLPTEPGAPAAPVALICAMPEEVAAICATLTDVRTVPLGPLEVRHGMLGKVPVVIALAGIGKVDAAIAATLLASAGARALVMAGVAGSLNPAVAVGDIVIGTRLIQHDYGLATDAGITTYAAGQIPFPDVAPQMEPRLDTALEERLRNALAGVTLPAVALRIDVPPRRPAVHFGTIATGDVFVSASSVRQRIADLGAIAVEMEGAAVTRVAQRFGIPCVVVRAASDLAGRASDLDMTAFLPAAARCVAAIITVVVPVL
jgi:adenosylhomocysteine nucleosidase